MRGEHSLESCGIKPIPGSSPHARGAPSRGRWSRLRHGIIPACAGSTLLLLLAMRTNHPRMRGEHSRSRRTAITAGGSSPHARGALGNRSRAVHGTGIIPACAGSTHAPYMSEMWRSGIIPACAGSTRQRSWTWHLTRDHPRMRGEHSATILSNSVSFGIIPACAGSTGC